MGRFRAVVVGAGGISNAWFKPLLAEKVAVPAVVDLRLEAAERRIRQYELDAFASTDLAATLKRVRPDFVVDLTTPEAHCPVTCAALRAGCHVVGEKPMASSMAEARRMVRAAVAADRCYMVSQSRRWDVRHDRVRRAVCGGRIGRLTTINCDFYVGAHFGGFRAEMPSPLIVDMAIHHFDLARFMTGADPVAVYAREFNPPGSWYAGDVAAGCIFEMTDGVVFTYRGSWCAEGCPTSWNGNWRFIGERGTLLYEQDQDPRGEVAASSKGFQRPCRPVRVPASPIRHTGIRGAVREMLRLIRTGRAPQTDCRDNIRSLAMVFGAMESSRRRRRVPIAGD